MAENTAEGPAFKELTFHRRRCSRHMKMPGWVLTRKGLPPLPSELRLPGRDQAAGMRCEICTANPPAGALRTGPQGPRQSGAELRFCTSRPLMASRRGNVVSGWLRDRPYRPSPGPALPLISCVVGARQPLC